MKRGGDTVFRGIVMASAALAVLACVMMMALLFSRPAVLQMVMPLRNLYAHDHAITSKGLSFLGHALDVTAWLLLGAACMTFLYALIGRYATARLPAAILAMEGGGHPVSKMEKIFIAAIMGLGLLLRTIQINRGLCYDELFTAHNFVNVDSFWKTISTYSVFNNHIAYSVCARCAQLWLGQSELVIRLPALLFGLAAIYAVWKFGRRLLGGRGGLMAALLLCLSPLHVVYSELARGYTGMMLFVFISSILFLKLLAHSKKRDALCYILASVLAAYFHLYSLLVIGVQVLMVLGLVVWQLREANTVVIRRDSFRTLWLSFFMIMLGCVICYLPVATYLAVYVQARGRGAFQPWFPWQVVNDLSGNPGVIMALVMVMVALMGLRSLWTVHWRLALYCVCIFILPIMVVMVVRPSDLYTRFFIFALPWHVLILTRGGMAIWQQSVAWGRAAGVTMRLALVVLAIGVGVRWTSHVSWNYASGPFNGCIAPYRALGQAMLSQAGSNVCLCAFGEGCEELSYYAGQTLKVPCDLNELRSYIRGYDEVRCAYNVTLWDTPEQRKMAQFLGANGTTVRFAESRPCQEVVLFTIPGEKDKRGSR